MFALPFGDFILDYHYSFVITTTQGLKKYNNNVTLSDAKVVDNYKGTGAKIQDSG